jgi:multimeric flavodoxin WrbA
MKVLLINGSPNKKGCTYTALNEIATTLNQEGIETDIYYIGTEPIAPCRDCRACNKLQKCVINDKVNELLSTIHEYDGFVIGSPVHYASASGSISPFLDRLFFAGSRIPAGNPFRLKPGTAVVSCRRAGSTATLDQLNKYFLINQMPIISGRYWNMVHGSTPEQVKQDLEGMQNMRIVGKNMAWHLKCKQAGLEAGIVTPEAEETIYTNFIRE